MIEAKSRNAYKWSVLTELLSKLSTPIINMVLARLLMPEDFGVLATIMMIIQFAEVFVESGFQKVLIQREFTSQQQERRYMSVALWSSLLLACLIWGAIVLFRNELACVVGNCTLGTPIAITGVMIPLHAVIGIWNCKLKKELEFSRLFPVRLCSAFVPLVVTVPLAYIGMGFWALIVGNITGTVVRLLLLLFLGTFKPKLYYSFEVLRVLFKDGIWTLLDGVAIWFTSWVDSLLISRYMSEYYVGLYKNSVSTVMSFYTIITASITPVLFSTLSKVQSDHKEFENVFLNVQNVLLKVLLPISLGMFLFRDFAVTILFGDSWMEAANIIGVTAITLALRSVFVSMYSDVFRARGKFYWPLVLQCIDIIVIISICLPAIKSGFWDFVYVRAIARMDLIIPCLFLAKKVCRISIAKSLKGLFHPIVAVISMCVAGTILRSYISSLEWHIIAIFICAAVYLFVLCLFTEERRYIISLFRKGKSIIRKSKR